MIAVTVVLTCARGRRANHAHHLHRKGLRAKLRVHKELPDRRDAAVHVRLCRHHGLLVHQSSAALPVARGEAAGGGGGGGGVRLRQRIADKARGRVVRARALETYTCGE